MWSNNQLNAILASIGLQFILADLQNNVKLTKKQIMLNTYISLSYWGLLNMEQKALQKQQTNFLESFAVTK